jgi:rubredoxin
VARFECPVCGWRGRPDVTYSISTAGWVFVGVGVLFWPLIVLGLFLKEGWQTCPDCGTRVKRIGGVEFRG